MSTPSTPSSEPSQERELRTSALTERHGLAPKIATLAFVGLAVSGCLAGKTKPEFPLDITVAGGEIPSADKVLSFIQEQNPDTACHLTRDNWYFRDSADGRKEISNMLTITCDPKPNSMSLIAPIAGETLPTKPRKLGDTWYHVSLDCKKPTLTVDQNGFPSPTSCSEVSGSVDKYNETSDEMTVLLPLSPELLKPSSSGKKNEKVSPSVTKIVALYEDQLRSVAAQQLAQPADSLKQRISWEKSVKEPSSPSLMLNFAVGSSLSQERTFFCDAPQFQQKDDTIMVSTEPCREYRF